MKRFACILLFLAVGLVRIAADPIQSKAADSVIYPRGTAGAVETEHAAPSTGFTTLVIGGMLAAGGLWLLWRSRRDSKLVGSRGKLVVAETKSLGNKQYLVVAVYGEQKFLLGVCPGKIDMLSVLETAKETTP